MTKDATMKIAVKKGRETLPAASLVFICYTNNPVREVESPSVDSRDSSILKQIEMYRRLKKAAGN